MIKKLAIINSGVFPIPPTKGGAVENLIQELIEQNAKRKLLDFCIFSIWDSKAYKESKKWNLSNNEFVFIKIPRSIKLLNIALFYFFTKILRKKKVMSYRYLASRLYFIFRVAFFLHKRNYDFVILENHTTLFWCIKLFGNFKKYKNKYIYHMHNKLSGFYKCKKQIRMTPLVIGVSQYILNVFKKQVPNYSAKTKFRVLKNKIEVTKFQKKYKSYEILNEKKKIGIPLNKKIVLFAGRLNKEKGIDKLIKAWKYIKNENSILLIVGSYYYKSGINDNGSFNQYLNKLINKSKNIYFTGYIDHSEMPLIYAMSNIVVLPSIWEDPAPLTVVESLSAGRPLITTNSGGIPEYINNTYSIMINKKSRNFEKKLSIEINNLILNPKKEQQMEEKAFEVTKSWDEESFYNNFVTIISELF